MLVNISLTKPDAITTLAIVIVHDVQFYGLKFVPYVVGLTETKLNSKVAFLSSEDDEVIRASVLGCSTSATLALRRNER